MVAYRKFIPEGELCHRMLSVWDYTLVDVTSNSSGYGDVIKVKGLF